MIIGAIAKTILESAYSFILADEVQAKEQPVLENKKAETDGFEGLFPLDLNKPQDFIIRNKIHFSKIKIGNKTDATTLIISKEDLQLDKCPDLEKAKLIKRYERYILESLESKLQKRLEILERSSNQ